MCLDLGCLCICVKWERHGTELHVSVPEPLKVPAHLSWELTQCELGFGLLCITVLLVGLVLCVWRMNTIGGLA